jgi:hypothetical protein
MEIYIGEIVLEEEIEINDIILEEEIVFSPLELDTMRVIMDDYNKLKNKPSINEVELVDNKQLEDLNINRLTNTEIEDLINSIII